MAAQRRGHQELWLRLGHVRRLVQLNRPAEGALIAPVRPPELPIDRDQPAEGAFPGDDFAQTCWPSRSVVASLNAGLSWARVVVSMSGQTAAMVRA